MRTQGKRTLKAGITEPTESIAMSIRRPPTLAPRPRRAVATALAVALALASQTPLAREAPQPGTSPQLVTRAGTPETSPNRINGRVDWDVDYPSQIAPQAVQPRPPSTRGAAVDATSTSPVAQNHAGTQVPAP